MGSTFPYQSTDGVIQVPANTIPAFSGMSYDMIGNKGPLARRSENVGAEQIPIQSPHIDKNNCLPFIKIVIILVVLLAAVAYSVCADRRISAFGQNRLGPNRVDMLGLLQPVADGVKLIFKESIVLRNVNKPLYDLGLVISLTVALATCAVIPFGDAIHVFGREIELIIADVNLGILYVLALSSISL